MDSNELLVYACSVVLVPAVVACLAAAPALVGPFRTRRSLVELSTAFALPLAFLVSFVREADLETVSRQFPWSSLDGSAPIERWHRLALIAVGLAVVAPILATLRAAVTRGMDRLLSGGCIVGAAFVIGMFVQFPDASVERQILQGALCAASALTFMLAGGAVLWVAAVAFGAVAALTLLSGCASFAVISAATALAAGCMAVTAAIGGWKSSSAVEPECGGAFALVAGVLLASIAMAGRAYDTMDIPGWSWITVACLPVGVCFFRQFAVRAPHRASATFWRLLGVAVLAIGVLLAVAIVHPVEESGSSDSADPMDGIYGG